MSLALHKHECGEKSGSRCYGFTLKPGMISKTLLVSDCAVQVQRAEIREVAAGLFSDAATSMRGLLKPPGRADLLGLTLRTSWRRP
jgi:hypothetical protein